MLRRLIAAGLTTAAVLLGAVAEASPKQKALPAFDCAGPFGADSSEAALIRRFGRKHVVFRTVPAPEGEMVKATVLFPNDRARRVEITWLDERRRRRPAEVLIYNPGPWRAPEGIMIGATLAEVEAANGKPFTLSGFGWDYGGSVLDWDGGRLARPGCRFQLRFEPTALADAVDVDGDREFRSDNANMRAVKPVVYQMLIAYP
ncbi:hypothetical protein ABLE93_04660 [Xanthobacter sp. KR7-65]|uniref:hypothetical protein n=1 Tax=Xanthobacter sp. KR7-65 TaxID=3156612 RepID=UPI0032B4E787